MKKPKLVVLISRKLGISYTKFNFEYLGGNWGYNGIIQDFSDMKRQNSKWKVKQC